MQIRYLGRDQYTSWEPQRPSSKNYGMPEATRLAVATPRSFGKTSSLVSTAGIAARKQIACASTTVRNVPGILSSGDSLFLLNVASLSSVYDMPGLSSTYLAHTSFQGPSS